MNKNRLLGSLLVFLVIIGAMLVPSMAAAQVTYYYSNNTEINQVAFTVTITNPQNQSTYSKFLPLQVDLIWNVSLESLLDTHMPVKGYAYAIDNNQLINMAPNGSLAVPRKEAYYFNYSVDVSSLSQGNHKLSVIIWQYYNNSNYQGLFNQTSTPIIFEVDNTLPATATPTLSPSPTVPELSWLAIVPLLLAPFCIAILTWRRKVDSSRY
jgi:hypothetical protein